MAFAESNRRSLLLRIFRSEIEIVTMVAWRSHIEDHSRAAPLDRSGAAHAAIREERTSTRRPRAGDHGQILELSPRHAVLVATPDETEG
jgi:hypothetical protein